MANGESADKIRRRMLRFLASGPATIEKTGAADRLLLDAGERGAICVDRAVLAAMARDGTLLRQGESVSLSPDAIAAARRGDAAGDGFLGQHRDLATQRIEIGGEMAAAVVNLAESPLGQLMRLKTRDGATFLGEAEFVAGERLRADYTRGQIMPRLGANWEACGSSGTRSQGGASDLTDAALAARQRVDAAINAVGPELSGVLIDVCCFLKGLELVERERGWPVRSAKIILKSALGVLSRHYNPRQRRATPRALHWGSDDYRPIIG